MRKLRKPVSIAHWRSLSERVWGRGGGDQLQPLLLVLEAQMPPPHSQFPTLILHHLLIWNGHLRIGLREEFAAKVNALAPPAPRREPHLAREVEALGGLAAAGPWGGRGEETFSEVLGLC